MSGVVVLYVLWRMAADISNTAICLEIKLDWSIIFNYGKNKYTASEIKCIVANNFDKLGVVLKYFNFELVYAYQLRSFLYCVTF